MSQDGATSGYHLGAPVIHSGMTAEGEPPGVFANPGSDETRERERALVERAMADGNPAVPIHVRLPRILQW